MLFRTSFFFIIFFLLAAASRAGECAKGTKTDLQIERVGVPLIPRHEQGIGRTKLVLRSGHDDREIVNKTFDGSWFCFSFSKSTGSYIVGGIMERGAWLALGSVLYLREDGSSFKQSAFDRSGYLALTSATSPGGRYVVFIGGRDAADGLYVLDTEHDAVMKLGRAPAPPPASGKQEICGGEPFTWGSCWADGYDEMDKGIIRFESESVLTVSYGDDGPLARSNKRRVRQFPLDRNISTNH